MPDTTTAIRIQRTAAALRRIHPRPGRAKAAAHRIILRTHDDFWRAVHARIEAEETVDAIVDAIKAREVAA